MENIATSQSSTLSPVEPKVKKAIELTIDPRIRRICRVSNSKAHYVELSRNRRRELKKQITEHGVNTPIFAWASPDGKNYILDGIEIYCIAKKLGLTAGIDYEVVFIKERNGKAISNMQDAMRWRYERNISTHKNTPAIIAVIEAIELFTEEIAELKVQAKKNKKQGVKVDPKNKIDVDLFIASKAGVSKSTYKRYRNIHRELMKHVEDKNKDNFLINNARLLSMIHDLEYGNKSVKAVSEDIKHALARSIKEKKNSENAKVKNENFSCDTGYDRNKSSQIIHGNSLEQLEVWASSPEDNRPCPHVIFGSPPYWIEANKRKGKGKGNIQYGKDYQRFLDTFKIKCWKSYKENLIRPYLLAAYKILPEGGSFIWQVDNTTGIDKNNNRIKFFHDHAVLQIGQEVGFLAIDKIIWHKKEISGNAASIGSRHSPNFRPVYESLVVLKKGKNRIEGDFDSFDEFNEFTRNFWSEKSADQFNEFQKQLFHEDVWTVPAGRNKEHPATFSRQLAVGVVNMFCPLNGLIIDPWNGIGTTCIAAQICNRNYIGIDIEKGYCEKAVTRLEQTKVNYPKIVLAGEPLLKPLMPKKHKPTNSKQNPQKAA